MGRAHVSPRGCAYKYAVSPNPGRHEQITSAHAHAHRRSFAAAAAGDSIPSSAYMAEEEQVSETTPFWFLSGVRGE